jgi:hypothetical protein
MMVIDNLDDLDSNLHIYIPIKCSTILYTTRDGRLSGHPAYVFAGAGIEVGAMSWDEALETFMKYLGLRSDTIQVSEECPRELLELLGYLPLAIAHNDSTSPAMDQSRPEPSSPVQVQSKKFLDWDRTDPRC